MAVLKTKDGSNTFISPVYDEAFHSKHGAVAESQHVFIENGLQPLLSSNPGDFYLFEMGFGSGLNVLLSALYHQSSQSTATIYMDTIEKHPLSWEQAKELQFCDHILNTSCEDLFNRLHNSHWNKPYQLSPQFYIQKLKDDLLKFDMSEDHYHLIYYDAFAPSAQPELWSEGICRKLHRSLRAGGLLCTYCAQGQFKRNLKAAGFNVEAVDGPPGKREMTLARKS